MPKITINVPTELKCRMDEAGGDWNLVAVNAFRDALKLEKQVMKSTPLRTKLMLVPKKVTDSWTAFFAEKPKKKPSRKPF